MKLRSLLIGVAAMVLVGAGAAWSVGSNPDQWIWNLAPKGGNYTPDPKDTNFYYPLPQVVEFTSPFGWRTHPLYGDRRLHSGADLGAPEGMLALSAHAGYVRYADWGDGYGNMVIVEYADGKYQTVYAHLSEILVRDGEAVRPRQVIGKVGATGGVTGPHLHFELRKKTGGDFEAIDPMAQLKAVESYVAVRPADPPTTTPDSHSPTAIAKQPTAPADSTELFTAPGLEPDNATLSFDPTKFKP
jgi:murein DD-endopeptidase MepM/ murein hydrolase activator NlpD